MRFHKSSNNHHNDETEDIISQETADHLKWIENNIQTTTLIDAYVFFLSAKKIDLIFCLFFFHFLKVYAVSYGFG